MRTEEEIVKRRDVITMALRTPESEYHRLHLLNQLHTLRWVLEEAEMRRFKRDEYEKAEE